MVMAGIMQCYAIVHSENPFRPSFNTRYHGTAQERTHHEWKTPEKRTRMPRLRGMADMATATESETGMR